jgi:glyoxylase-like metal-dependent hydrolase (beta-lactamase superfamily II)
MLYACRSGRSWHRPFGRKSDRQLRSATALGSTRGERCAWAGSRQDTVPFNRKHAVKLTDGDYDIFEDGSLVLISTPGHTPGHQLLLVRLSKTGPVILNGDAAHFQTSFEHRYVPTNSWSKEATLLSMDKIAAVIAKEHAQLWLNNDQAQSDAQKRLPAYYD